MRMSVMDRRVNCPASENLEANFPDTTNPAAERGTHLHAMCEHRYLKGGWEFGDTPEEDQAEARWAWDRMCELTKGLMVLTEEEVEFEGVLGHADVIAYDGETIEDSSRAVVLDYKFGRSPVEVDGNWQLRAYAVAVREMYDLEEVAVGIIQPATDTAAVITYDKDTLLEFAGVIRDAITLTQQDVEPVVGPHCKWCKAREVCPSRSSAIATIPKHADLVSFTRTLSEAQRGDLWTRMEQVADWIKRAQEVIKDQKLPMEGYKYTEGRKMKKWKDEAAVKAEFEDRILETSLMTPAKALKAGLDVSDHIEIQLSKPSVKKV